jgi:hypothetical protein
MVGSDEVVVVERRRGRGLRMLVGLLVLAVLVVAVVLIVLATKESSGAKDDVSITTCEPASGGGKPTASGQIDNPTSKDSNYTIRLDFVDAAGNTVSQGATSVRDVAAGGTASWELTGVRSAEGPVHCELTGVSRTHLPGQ